MSFLGDACVVARGLLCQKETCKRLKGGKCFGAWSFKPMRTHVMKFSAPCPVVKQKHDAGNTAFKKFGAMMTSCKIFFEFGMCSKNYRILRTNQTTKQKRVDLKRLGG